MFAGSPDSWYGSPVATRATMTIRRLTKNDDLTRDKSVERGEYLERQEAPAPHHRRARGTPAPEIVSGEIVDLATTLTGHVPFKAFTELPMSEHTEPFIVAEPSGRTSSPEMLARINAGQLVTPTDRTLFASRFERSSQRVIEEVRAPNLRRWTLAIAAILALAVALAIGLSGTQVF
jgi:hypothetical protein